MTDEINQGMYRKNLYVGAMVEVIQKKDYNSSPLRLVTGEVAAILTSKPFHSRGCKVKLAGSGIVGRVQRIIPEER